MDQKDTKIELLSHARRLLLDRGYNGFSFQDLADKLHIRKASIHYYFASKTDLLEVLITDYDRSFDEFITAHSALPPDERLRKYFRLFRRMTEEGHICLAGALSVDSGELPAKLKRKLVEHQIKHRRWLRDLLDEGRGKVFHRSVSPKDDSLLIGASLQGALQIARLHDSPALVDHVIDSLERRLLGGPR